MDDYYEPDDKHDNELTIRTQYAVQTSKILRVLEEAEDNGELDFGFTVIRNSYPR